MNSLMLSAVETESLRSLRRHILTLIVLSLALLLGFGGWVATSSLASAVIASGTVTVENNVKKVQHLSGGIVSHIFVREGQWVKAGEVLVKLDEAAARAQLSIAESSLATLYVRRARLQAERTGRERFSVDQRALGVMETNTLQKLEDEERNYFETRKTSLEVVKSQLTARKSQLLDEINGLEVQIKAYQSALELIREQSAHVGALFASKLAVRQQVYSVKLQEAEMESDLGERIAMRAQAGGKISEIDLQITQLSEDRRAEISKELTEVEANIAESEERRNAAATELNRLEIHAPTDGQILQLSVHTVGGVINAGEPIMLIVPATDALTVEAKIAVYDIDKVHLGQPVDIRFTAFNQRTTPEVDGEVVSVAPDAVRDELTGLFFYPIRVRPHPESLMKLVHLALHPGMPAEVFIKIADRPVASYFLKPITDQMQHALRED